MFPLLIGSLFFVSAGAGRAWLRVLCHPPGWLVFLALVLPWHVMVYLDQGDAFFRGFYLQHNLNRYTSTFEGHGGNPLYYFAVLPGVLLPFTGWLLAVGDRFSAGWRRLGAASSGELLERFLLIWFAVVFVFFSLSRTQLPHYLLYGCTPVFILLARHRLVAERRWFAFLPAIVFALGLAGLPQALEFAAGRLERPLEIMLLNALTVAFADDSRWWLAGFALLVLGLASWRRLPVWQGLLIVGLCQAALLGGLVLPKVLDVTQGPVRDLALVARRLGGPVVAYQLHQPSFSVYRQAVTPRRLPRAGELVLTRRDRFQRLRGELLPLQVVEIQGRGHLVLARVVSEVSR